VAPMELYGTQKIAGLVQKMRQPTLATRTSTATSLLFLFAILAVGMASMYSFRTQLTNVMIAPTISTKNCGVCNEHCS